MQRFRLTGILAAELGEEGVDAGFTDGGPYERIGVLADIQEYDERIHQKSHEEIGGDEDAQQLDVAEESGEAARSDGLGNEAHDAHRCAADDPLHHGGDAFGDVIQKGLCSGRSGAAEGDAHDDGPAENADVVGIEERGNRIVHDAQNEIVQDLHDAARRFDFRIGHLQMQRGREEKGQRDPHEGRAEGAEKIQKDDRLHVGIAAGPLLGHGIHDEEKDQHWSDAFQGAHEEVAEMVSTGTRDGTKTAIRMPMTSPTAICLIRATRPR